MPNGANGKEFPTMIIPKGTEIRVNDKGQLSIKTPGNLVIQNSGNYSLIRSENGSIRIEDNVSVEAVDIQAADTCYVQGKLTAWRVKARKLSLENTAEAYVMLRESSELDVAKTARLVGNFASEREVYLLLGRFSTQLKSLPDMVTVSDESAAQRLAPPASMPPAADNLQLARVILDREIHRGIYDQDSQQALIEIHHAIQEGDSGRLRNLFGALSGTIKEPSEDLLKAFDYIKQAL
ncbi:MAG TPA: hypothetical protein PK014_13160 [Thermoanaerobaculia bacterium]|nr:hypothetical protein [Thermoanaerobaculia bacterium]HUM31049.1 hypothetical protein [Thermoanaerobaculia bacterium]HXK69347.1 hypothetical protein [Thermoanaerobaculia bacterium]